MSTDSETARKLARDYLLPLVSDEDRRLINAATFDLYHGPHGAGWEPDGDGWAYPGWEAACERIYVVLAALPAAVYVDTDCGYVRETEPEGYWIDGEANDEDGEDDIPREWVEPEPFYTFDRADIRRIVLGRELAANL